MKRLIAIALGCIMATSAQTQEWKYERTEMGNQVLHELTLSTQDVSNCSPMNADSEMRFVCHKGLNYKVAFGVSFGGCDFTHKDTWIEDVDTKITINGREFHMISNVMNFAEAKNVHAGDRNGRRAFEILNSSNGTVQLVLDMPELLQLPFIANFDVGTELENELGKLPAQCRM